ncbi:MAG: succinate dehydrogenase/fumarate reductase iron-sulfur subunit [Candidatus Omnitrophica bacterium]|nr:succinate dehydrogenase/fumarate reductase iron-sulfur subunit [Candidatus Omnitrophota bacterium]
MSKKINLTLKVWRQKCGDPKGHFETYAAKDVDTDMSFLEMLDVVNEGLSKEGKDPIAFDHDCREGICGACGAVVNGQAHGPQQGTTLCQLHMRNFSEGQTLVIEPWRAQAFPVIKDLIVNRSAFDRIILSGGFVSIKTGSAPEAHTLPVPKKDSDTAMDAAGCIGCGACVAACPNGSAMLFVGAKVSHLSFLPQGRVEADKRVQGMIKQMDKEGFGNCSNVYECEAACPKSISVAHIARMNKEFRSSSFSSE